MIDKRSIAVINMSLVNSNKDINPDQVKELKKKIIDEYLNSEKLPDVSGNGCIANVNESANGKPRVGQMKQLLDKARHIYWNLRHNDMQHMSEEFWEDNLMLLAGLCPSINLVNQYAVLDKTSNTGNAGVRFFDIVEVRPKKVRVFELKARQINVDDVRSTIESGSFIGRNGSTKCKNYLEVMKEKWHDKERALIFTSPFGIEKEALALIESKPDVFYTNYREIARLIYKEILNQYPTEAEWKYESIKNDKYRAIF